MDMYAHIAYLKGRRSVDMRKEAERLGLVVGKKIKHIRRKVNGEDNDYWTIVNKKDTIFKYIFWERLDSLPIPESCFHFVWCQIA